MTVAGQHLVLYDGVCGLCNAVVQFLLPAIGVRASTTPLCKARLVRRGSRGSGRVLAASIRSW